MNMTICNNCAHKLCAIGKKKASAKDTDWIHSRYLRVKPILLVAIFFLLYVPLNDL